MIKSIFTSIGFLYIGFSLTLMIHTFAQPSPPHVSAITPPMVPAIGNRLFLRKAPANMMMLYVPPGKTAELYSVSAMQTDELLEKVRTNRNNLYLLELTPKTELVPVMVPPEDLVTLSNLHQSMPQHP